jgi:hypothetical protein
VSEALGLRLALIDGILRFIDPRTGAVLPARAERPAAAEARIAELEALPDRYSPPRPASDEERE